MKRLYVYALVGERRRTTRAGGRRIEFVPVGSMYAAVERRPAAPEISEPALRAQHQILVELARGSAAILPARFGAWIEAAELQRVVSARDAVLRRALDLVRSREQMTVRIFGREAPPRLDDVRRSSGTAYLRSRRAAAKLPAAAASLRRIVRPLVAAERVDPGRGRMRAALHHLVERGSSAQYKALVQADRVLSRISDEVVVSGPWPPFAFAPDIWS